MTRLIVYTVVGILFNSFCYIHSFAQIHTSDTAAYYSFPIPTDAKLNKRGKALFYNLHHLAPKQVLFGHQDDLAYGVHWRAEKNRSDVRETCGSYPAVFGWDLSKLGQEPFNIDTVDFKHMRKLIKQAYKMGGVNTISWHLDNPVSGGNAWDTTRAVAHILPGGSHHQAYRKKLDLLAAFIKRLNYGFMVKHQIPILFRPFHEHTGSWFWWGAQHCEPSEYRTLWKFTISYLREEKGLHNLIIVYSPDIFHSKEEYLRCYPGDQWVDVLGLDDYHDVSRAGHPEKLTQRLCMLVELAREKAKLAALTETGLETIPNYTWWTDILLKHIKHDATAHHIAYMLVWRNAWPHHHYAPFRGHKSAADFVKFRNDPSTWFQEDLPDLYRKFQK